MARQKSPTTKDGWIDEGDFFSKADMKKLAQASSKKEQKAAPAKKPAAKKTPKK